MKFFIKRHQIPIFFAVTLIIGWFPWYTGRGSIIYAAPLLAAFIVLFLLMAERGFWIYCVGWGGGGQTGAGTFSSYFHPQLSTH